MITATNNSEGKKKQARNTLKVVRMDKNFILGDAMSVKKYVQSIGGGGGGGGVIFF